MHTRRRRHCCRPRRRRRFFCGPYSHKKNLHIRRPLQAKKRQIKSKQGSILFAYSAKDSSKFLKLVIVRVLFQV